MQVHETFFSLSVRDMERATAFYRSALGATVTHASAFWSSLHVAGVRIGLFHDPAKADARVGLHFVVDDLVTAHEAIVRAGGRVIATNEVAPGVIVSDVVDTEGNTIALGAR